MPNTYFQFKQFRIEQEHCAMKVGTDACILGAWFANRIVRGGRVLDIGSGTGLLMLMLAQQHDGSIEGIELQESCFKQLRSNLESSPWSDRLRAWHGDVKKFETGQRFDFIVSNPPFFEDDLHSPSSGKNLAKHSTELTLDELLLTIDRLLTGDGHFGVLLPHHRTDYFIGLAKSLGFYMKEKLLLQQTPNHNYFRSILHFSRQPTNEIVEETLTIHERPGQYSQLFIDLLKDYYLYL